MKVKRALISVFNKAGLEEFARALADMGVEIISTGGTARLLGDHGIPVTEVADVTQFPEMLGGRVKTMHPRIQAGILARRDDPEHMATIAEHGIEPIDMVVVSLYPFEEVSAQRGTPEDAVIEMIDIGGPTMIRAAAKNHESVAVITEPDDYASVLDELKASGGELSLATCRHLATKAFHRTAHYDFVIANWFSETEGDFPSHILRDYEKVMELSYGENPHQRAAYYAESGARRHLLSRVTQLHGKKLSFNNLYDLHAARSLASEFALPACVIIKHNNPCGSALAETLERAYLKALECDPVSAFGSVIAVNRPVDLATAQRMSELFIEVLFAPSYDDDALELLSRKPDIRILVDNERRKFSPGEMDYKRVLGGLLDAGPRRRPRGPRVDGGGQRTPPERGRVGRPDLRQPCGQARQVERHRDRQEPRLAGRRRRSDEPRRLHAPGDREVARRPAGRGGRLRCLLPLPRRRRARHRQRGDRLHAAGRLQARRSLGQDVQRPGRRHGLLAPAPFPSLATGRRGTLRRACAEQERALRLDAARMIR